MDGRWCRESARRTARRSNDHSRRLFLCNRSRDSKSRRSTRLPSASPLYYPEQNVNITYNHVGGEDKLRGGSGCYEPNEGRFAIVTDVGVECGGRGSVGA